MQTAREHFLRGFSVLSLILVMLAGGCATSAEAGGRDGTSRDVVTRAEIADTAVSNAFQALERLRPRWLRSRGPVSVEHPEAGNPVVYMDGTRFGPLRTLRQIGVEVIGEIRYMDPNEATNRFGAGHTGGVIMVLTRR